MNVFYSDKPLVLNPFNHSVFLAGPTPRSRDVQSWRPRALEIFKQLKYQGQVIVPEHETWTGKADYIDQVEWENLGTESCTKLLVWVPRDLVTMPAFTTNVEFGRYVASGKMVYGRPDDAPKNRYLDWLYKKFNSTPIYNNLEDLIEASL
jgi:hypothetical protein